MINLLFEFLSPMGWTTSQVANIISTLSAIVTALTLLYAIKQGKENKEDIGKLATIANHLSEQNSFMKYQLKVQAKPDFMVNQTFDAFGLLEFKINVFKNPIFVRYLRCADGRLNAKADEDIWVRESSTYMFTIYKDDDSKKYHEYDLMFFMLYHDVHSNFYEAVILYEKEKWTVESVDVVAPLDRKPTTHL